MLWRAVSRYRQAKKIKADSIFRQFEPWQGHVKAGFRPNFVGQFIDVSFVDGGASPDQGMDRDAGPLFVEANEETFEWHSLLSAVLEAKQRFVMLELGAGFGRWLVGAACAVRRKRPDLPISLIGVEAEPTHFQWMHKHFRDNGLDPDVHHLIKAPIAGSRRKVVFTVGDARAWYGQAIVSTAADVPDNETVELDAITLADSIALQDKIDLVDMDIQGAELEVVQSSADVLNAKVRRVHIGTHSPEIEAGLREFLGALGWRCVWDFGCLGNRDTPYGRIEFQDGAQAWVNPRL